MGPIGLHGGGEYLAGDEPFLRLLVEAAAVPAAERARVCGGPSEAKEAGAIRIAVVPTATAGERPDLSGAHGVSAFRAIATALGLGCRAEVVPIVDAGSAADPRLAGILAAADLVHLPGGNPGVVVDILDGSLAWDSILAARARGAVVAGASAGAMALAEWTWTPAGARAGLGAIRGLVVVPHFERVPPDFWRAERAAHGRDDVGILGLDERTGVLSMSASTDDASAWRVAGAGSATWLAPSAAGPIVARDGELIDLRGSAFATV